jgi:4-hydroxybenzoate polyprenyltransferase
MFTGSQTAFAVATAPLIHWCRLPHVIFWIWLHVLQCCVSNQTLDPEEDARNKPDRPIPARRLTIEEALILRWALVPACWIVSACYDVHVVATSIVLCSLTYLYNEMHFHGHFVTRNVFNALGIASFEIGSTLIAGQLSPSVNQYTCIQAIFRWPPKQS